MTTADGAARSDADGPVLGKAEAEAIMPHVRQLIDAVSRRDSDGAYAAWCDAVVAAREAGIPMTAVHAAITYYTAIQARAAGAAEERERIHDEIADRQRAESARNIPAAGSTAQAYDYARRIARGES